MQESRGPNLLIASFGEVKLDRWQVLSQNTPLNNTDPTDSLARKQYFQSCIEKCRPVRPHRRTQSSVLEICVDEPECWTTTSTTLLCRLLQRRLASISEPDFYHFKAHLSGVECFGLFEPRCHIAACGSDRGPLTSPYLGLVHASHQQLTLHLFRH